MLFGTHLFLSTESPALNPIISWEFFTLTQTGKLLSGLSRYGLSLLQTIMRQSGSKAEAWVINTEEYLPLNVVVRVLWSTKYGTPSGVYLISQPGGRGV